MPSSSSRKARRAAHAQQSKGPKPARTEEAPSLGVPAAVVQDEGDGDEEVNFLVAPRTGLGAGLASIAPMTGKTVRTPGPLNLHIQTFQTRQGGVKYQDTTNALWRALLAEDHAARRRAEEAERSTGLPAEVHPGPIFRAVARQLELMEQEKRDEAWQE